MSSAQISHKQCWIKRVRSTLRRVPPCSWQHCRRVPARQFLYHFGCRHVDTMPTQAKAEALSGLRTLLAPGRCLLLVVSSIAIYVNEWASFSTRDFSENRHASDGDRVRIIMLDVPNCCPVEDAVCTDAHYRHLLESAGLKVFDVQSPLATGKEAMRWVSETRTAAWTICVLGSVTTR